MEASFGERIKRLRSSKGITQEQLSHLLDIPESTIRRLETSDSLPRKERIHQLADFFNVRVDYLMGRADLLEDKKVSDSKEEINIAYFGGAKNDLTEEEAQHLEESLEMFRALKAKRNAEKNN
ncbi:XRE family transcriptional regulator [Paenibacillus psychroresistens]|uniref:XRE family transcriptional regulator n=1 Tax=Paenibacillus psychroresistens TaxID=1778678 RepID=A0A6B8RK78_9BACL|nr:helix-turn-helix transcriptional regulator [Paenibacillus psychroresistens]QGQ95826.1 XRE family transcriptional regulator [Paenibacillus psychroresistens]